MSAADPGVPASFVPRLFEPFGRASTGDRRAGPGMVRGLHTVRTYVEASEGSIAYDTEHGAGTGARFRLPLPGASGREAPR